MLIGLRPALVAKIVVADFNRGKGLDRVRCFDRRRCLMRYIAETRDRENLFNFLTAHASR
jgi:hypothetical protein